MLVNAELDIHKVRLPLPFRLNHIHCYAIQGSKGWWLIDTGLNTETTRSAWQQFMLEKGISAQNIKGIYLTHFHPDHFGAAGWLQQLSGAPVYIGELEAETVKRIWLTENPFSAQEMADMFNENGMAGVLTEQVVQEMGWVNAGTKPYPELTVVRPDDKVTLGDHQYKVILTPGHSDGHLCYFNEEQGVLFSGDHLLPKITSNISLWPDSAPNPLESYLQSLLEMRTLNCKLVLPAHGEPFTNMQERLSQLNAHHQERLEFMRTSAGRGSTAYEICRQVFGESLGLHEMRFAMAETLAHLMYLVYRGKLGLSKNGGVNIFTNPSIS